MSNSGEVSGASDAPSVLTLSAALATEAAASLLGGNGAGLDAVQQKIAAALTGQGLSDTAATHLADGWVRSFAAGVGASSSPDAAMAEAGRQMNGAAARMAQALQDSAALTPEQRLATALAQGQDVGRVLGGDGASPSTTLGKALFTGVMDQLARPDGAADPVAALSNALGGASASPTVVEAVALSPAEKLAAALASGGAVPDAVKALGADASGAFAHSLEQALSSGADVSASIAAAATQAAQGAAQAQAVAVAQSGGDRLLTALAAGGAEASKSLGQAGGGAAFTGVLGDALAGGAAPDAALNRSVRAQADTAAQERGSEVAPKPGDTLVASLASGRNVAETVKSFAAAAGLDPASAGGFGQSLGTALSSGKDAAGALGAAQQQVSASASMALETARGVKGDSLVAALASGQNVQQAVQAAGGAGAFGAALGQALAEGRSPGQALAAARQVADTVAQTSQGIAVPVSAESKALADLAAPPTGEAKGAEKASDKGAATEQVADAADAKDAKQADTAKDADAKTSEAKGEKSAPEGNAADKADGKAEAKDGKEAPSDKPVSDKPASDKPAVMDGGAFKAVGFSVPDSGAKSGVSGDGVNPVVKAVAASVSTAPVTKAGTGSTDAFAANQATQKIVETAERVVETVTATPVVPTPVPVTPTPVVHHALAPVAAAGFDAAALAKALAVAEGTAAPAGFTVFHLIEAMFRPGETGSSVVGVAVVANPGSALGVWEYSVDGTTWQAVGAVGDGAALVLPGGALLRFLPTAGASGAAPALGLRAVSDEWTGGFTGAGKTLFALGETGGTSPFSAEVGQMSLLVTAVNGAPVATGTAVALAAITEDATAPDGSTVSSLFAALFTDPTDAVNGAAGDAFAGVAVIADAASATQGLWQYWNGAAWTAVGPVSDGAALLLAADAKLRFLPAPDWHGTTPALTVRLIDDSQGSVTTGDHAALGEVGLTSRYSVETIALTQGVTAVNDAPVATGTAVVLAAIAEDATAPAGSSVSSLFAALFTDPTDAVNGAAGDAFAGVAVIADAASATQGLWQYWNGAAWTAVGPVSDGAALLLAADARLRFLPAPDWHGTTPALTVRLIDDSQGSVTTGDRAALGEVGLTSRYSVETIALTQGVTAVNDAPVATGASVSLAAVAEDTADPGGATVSALFGGLFSDAKDMVGGSAGDALAGIAIVGGTLSAAQGVWQYWNGSAWTAVGAVSEGSALIVAAADKLRFLPAADWNGEPPALSVRLVDGSAGAVASGARVDLAGLGVGGATPYSATTITLDTVVSAVNDAPVATGTAITLPTILEDAANPAGGTVASLFGGLFSDPADAVAGGSSSHALAGVVVVGNAATAAQGEWQYWTGSAWTAVGSVSGGNGLLLSTAAKLRFLPAEDWNGTTPALTVRLVDDSSGAISSGARVGLSGQGGTTRYSAETIVLTQGVTAVNDAPVATATTAALSAIAEDAANPAGETVSSVFAALFSDAADAVPGGSSANAFAGIAIVGNAAAAGQGVWQYWNGSAWTDVGAVTAATALLVKTTDSLRFVPAADWNGTAPALTVRLVDGSGGAVVTGAHADLTASGVGGSTAYGADSIALTGTVTAVNDAPTLTAATASLSTVKGVAVAVTGLSVADIDAGSTTLAVTLTAGHGTLTLDDGGLDAVITGNGTASVTVRATLDTINSLLGASNGLLYTAATFTGTDSVTVLVDDQGGGGTGGALTATATIGVTVVPPNASPVLTDTNLAVSTAAEASAAPGSGTAGIAVSALITLGGNVTDGDSGAVTGVALVGTNEDYGHWWFSTDGGASWSLVGTVNDSDSALLLRSTDRLYFQPGASVPGTLSNALTIHAWDQTSGTAGTKVAMDTTTGSAFSAATDSVTLHPGVLVPNGSFDNGLTGWSSTGGTSVGSTGDGHEGTLTSTTGKTATELEDFLGLSHGSIASATGTTPFAGHAMKLASTVTVTQDTTLSFDWSFTFTDSGSYQDFGFVSVNGAVTLLAKSASASGTFSVTIPANTTITLGFGASDTGDNSVNPILRVDHVKLSSVASDPIVLDMTGDGLALRPLSDNVHFDVTGDGIADQTGWIGAGNALLARDTDHNGRIDGAGELVSEKFGSGFNSSLEALRSLDSNHDGRLDAADSDYGTLLVWQDADGDGVSQPGELRSLAQAGIQSIATTATASDATLAGSRILGTTTMTMADGATHAVAGVAFDVKAAVSTVVQSQPAATTAQGGTDFAAMLTAGLGLPQAAPVAHDPIAGNGLEWMADAHDPNAHHPQAHDASAAHPGVNA